MMARFLFLFCVSLVLGNMSLKAQTTPQKDFYVMIGVFSELDDAVKLTEEANLNGFNAQYILRNKKKQYYVYLLQTTDQKKAKSFLEQIQRETKYKDAWLYKGKLGGEM